MMVTIQNRWSISVWQTLDGSLTQKISRRASPGMVLFGTSLKFITWLQILTRSAWLPLAPEKNGDAGKSSLACESGRGWKWKLSKHKMLKTMHYTVGMATNANHFILLSWSCQVCRSPVSVRRDSFFCTEQCHRLVAAVKRVLLRQRHWERLCGLPYNTVQCRHGSGHSGFE